MFQHVPSTEEELVDPERLEDRPATSTISTCDQFSKQPGIVRSLQPNEMENGQREAEVSRSGHHHTQQFKTEEEPRKSSPSISGNVNPQIVRVETVVGTGYLSVTAGQSSSSTETRISELVKEISDLENHLAMRGYEWKAIFRRKIEREVLLAQLRREQGVTSVIRSSGETGINDLANQRRLEQQNVVERLGLELNSSKMNTSSNTEKMALEIAGNSGGGYQNYVAGGSKQGCPAEARPGTSIITTSRGARVQSPVSPERTSIEKPNIDQPPASHTDIMLALANKASRSTSTPTLPASGCSSSRSCPLVKRKSRARAPAAKKRMVTSTAAKLPAASGTDGSGTVGQNESAARSIPAAGTASPLIGAVLPANNAQGEQVLPPTVVIHLCQRCHANPAQFICAGCDNQCYCSRECQNAAWEQHSETCAQRYNLQYLGRN